MYHTPVLLHTSIEGLNIHPSGTYVDVTYGGGGHSREILKHLRDGRLFAFDQDEDAQRNKIGDERFTLINQNFRNLKNALLMHEVKSVDGILADLGVSSHQFDSEERGFSIRFNALLDMRMNKQNELTAREIINVYSEAELKKILKMYGELDNPGRIVKKIMEARMKHPINTVNELKAAIESCVPKLKENQFYARIFQALRIEVNKELDALKEMLQQSIEILKPEGRLVVISYHSLEDRLVKNFIRSGNFEGEIEKDFFGNTLAPLKSITRKPIVPEEKEIEKNNRARSAKLRIAEKIN